MSNFPALGLEIFPTPTRASFNCLVCDAQVLPLYRVDFPIQHPWGMSSSKTVEVLDAVCTACGLVQHVPPKSSEEIARFYAQESSELGQFVLYDDPADNTFRANQADFVEACLEDAEGTAINQLILDAGAFNGRLLGELLSRGLNAYGLDVSIPINVLSAEIANRMHSALLDNAFDAKKVLGRRPDVVVASHVLEHTPNPVEFLRSCVGALAADGKIIVEVPDVLGAFTHDFSPFTNLEHTFNFSEETLLLVADRADLVATRIERVSGEPVVGNVIRACFVRAFEQEAADRPIEGTTFQRVRRLTATHEVYVGTLLDRIASQIRRVADEPLALFGAGIAGYRLLRVANSLGKPVEFLVDSDKRKHGNRVEDVPVLAPCRLADFTGNVFIASSAYYSEICEAVAKINPSLRVWSPWMSNES